MFSLKVFEIYDILYHKLYWLVAERREGFKNKKFLIPICGLDPSTTPPNSNILEKKLRHGRSNRRSVSASYVPLYTQNLYLIFVGL